MASRLAAAFAAALAFFILVAASADAGGPPTLEQICGPQNAIRVGGTLLEKCQAAYAAGNASLIENNNTYVHATAAIVCAHSCMGGGSNSCAGGGGGCSGARVLGNKAMADDRGSTDSWGAAQKNGTDALGLVTGPDRSKMFAVGSGTQASAATAVTALPSACATAAKSKTVQARIDCAAATDPSLPAFVKSPQFASDFQRITGYTLQDVFYQDTATLMKDYAPKALNNAFAQTKGKVPLDKFMKAGRSLLDGVTADLDPSDRQELIASVDPTRERATEPGAKPATEPVPEVLKAEYVPAADAALNAPPERTVASNADPATEEEEDRLGLSIFQRVSLGYRRAFTLGRVARD